MDIQEYERSGYRSYLEFANVVAAVLGEAIDRDGTYRLQQIARRAKAPPSLRLKLKGRKLLRSDQIERQIKDLAGCRLVFYTNDDVDRFLRSEIVRSNFKVDWDKTKFHHAPASSIDPSVMFRGTNYAVQLNEARLSLPEYSRFAGMVCEVQVQTTLNHAWSEMAHDTIYKHPPLKGFGGELMIAIQGRMATIMKKHLIPAGYEFQKVAADIKRLTAGRSLYEAGVLNQLRRCTNNNERHDLLQKMGDYVLPNIDDIRPMQRRLRKDLLQAMCQALNTPAVPVPTVIGKFRGSSAADVVEAGLDIIEAIARVNRSAVVETFDGLCEVFKRNRDKTVEKRLLESARRLAKNDFEIWKAAGPIVQALLARRIAGMRTNDMQQVQPLIETVLEQVLKPEVEGTSGNYKSITIKAGAAVASAKLRTLRRSALGSLLQLFDASTTAKDRRRIAGLLLSASRMPGRGRPSDGLIVTILENTIEVISELGKRTCLQQYPLVQHLEHELLWIYRHNVAAPGSSTKELAARKVLESKIAKFRDDINTNSNFKAFKVLVGYESVFPPAWTNAKFDLDGLDAYRSAELDKLASQVNGSSANWWLRFLEGCASTDTDDLGSWPSFGRFLETIGHTKPQIGMQFAKRCGRHLAGFLPSLLLGLSKSSMAVEANRLIGDWIQRRRRLRQIVHYLKYAVPFDAPLLEGALRAAIDSRNSYVVRSILDASARRHGDVVGGLSRRTFMPALRYLAEHHDTRWPMVLLSGPNHLSIIEQLTSAEVDEVLAALIAIPEIEYRVEELLGKIAATWPTKVIDLFLARIDHSKKRKRHRHEYEEVPYEFHLLQSPLSKVPAHIVEATRRRFRDDDMLFEFREGRLVANVFPSFSESIESPLLEIVAQDATKQDLLFVLKVLRNYQGEVELHPVLKEIVKQLEAGDVLLSEVMVVMESSGVVGGEFGMAEMYKRRKEELKPWLDDPDPRVKEFARIQSNSLDRAIAAELRRAEEDLELRRREWPAEDEQSGNSEVENLIAT